MGGGRWQGKGRRVHPWDAQHLAPCSPRSSVQLEAEGSPRLPSALLGRLFLSLPPSPQAPSLALPRLFLSSATSVSPSNPALAKPLVLSSSVSGSGSGSVSSLVHSLHLSLPPCLSRPIPSSAPLLAQPLLTAPLPTLSALGPPALLLPGLALWVRLRVAASPDVPSSSLLNSSSPDRSPRLFISSLCPAFPPPAFSKRPLGSLPPSLTRSPPPPCPRHPSVSRVSLSLLASSHGPHPEPPATRSGSLLTLHPSAFPALPSSTPGGDHLSHHLPRIGSSPVGTRTGPERHRQPVCEAVWGWPLASILGSGPSGLGHCLRIEK